MARDRFLRRAMIEATMPMKIAPKNGQSPSRLNSVPPGSGSVGTTSSTARLERRQPPGHPAQRVDGDGDPGIGGAQQRQAGLHRAQPRVVGVLGRADRAVEPGVVGDIEDELRFGRVADVAGEHRLVADQREERRGARRLHQAAAFAGGPAIGAGDELVDAEEPPERLERQVFAERHEMRLVVAGDDLAGGIEREDRVEARIVRDHQPVVADRLARRAGEQQRCRAAGSGRSAPAPRDAASGRTGTPIPATPDG